MDAAQCRAALAEIARFDPPLPILGGVAEDIVLHGDVVGDHGDIDVLVFRSELAATIAALQRIGFGATEVYFQEVRDMPLVLAIDKGTSHLEIAVCEKDDAGDVYYVLRGEADGFNRIYLPSGALDQPIVDVAGVPVRTLTPLALHHIREGLHSVRSFGGMRPKDVQARAAFEAAFFADADPGILVPRVEPVPPPTA